MVYSPIRCFLTRRENYVRNLAENTDCALIISLGAFAKKPGIIGIPKFTVTTFPPDEKMAKTTVRAKAGAMDFHVDGRGPI